MTSNGNGNNLIPMASVTTQLRKVRTADIRILIRLIYICMYIIIKNTITYGSNAKISIHRRKIKRNRRQK